MSTNLVELHAFKGHRYEGEQRSAPLLKFVLEMSMLGRGQELQEMRISLAEKLRKAWENVIPVPWHSCTIKA